MKKYKAVNDREISQITRILALCSGFILIGISIYILSIYTAIVGVVILLALILNKNIFATEDGIYVVYDMVFFKHKEFWPYEDIIEIQKESPPDRTKLALHFTKKSLMAKRIIFRLDDAYSVIDLALSRNPEIQVSSESE